MTPTPLDSARFRLTPWPVVLIAVLCLQSTALTPLVLAADSPTRPEELAIPKVLDNIPAWAIPPKTSPSITTTTAFPEAGWWEQYNDATLTQLINTALEHNHDIGSAAARLDEARALTRQTRAAQFPTLSVGANVSKQRNIYNSNSNGNNNNGNTGGSGFQVIAPNVTSTVFNAPIRAAYEPDIWLKHWDNTHAKRLREKASTAELRAMRLTVASDVATSYFNYVAASNLVEIFKRAHDVALADEAAAKAQFELGLISEDGLSQKQNQSARLFAQESDLIHLANTTRHQLAVLTGQLPEQFEALPLTDIQRLPIDLPIHQGRPAELLSERPDLIEQEFILMASNVDVRAARKAFLPSFNLSGQLGYTGLSIGSFSLETLAWNAAAGVTQLLFSGGARRAEVKAAKARREEAIHNYQQQILEACREVDDALSGINNAQERYQQFMATETAVSRQDALQQARIEAGALAPNAAYQQALQTLEAKSQVIQGRLAVLVETVSLYKALGGGF